MNGIEVIESVEQTLEKILKNIEEIVADVSPRFFDLMEEMNRDQLRAGKNNQGQDLFSIRPYAESTIMMKKAKGQPTNKVTFFDQGNLYRRIQAKKYNQFIEITTDVPQTQELIDGWGEFEGLTPENLDLLKQQMRPEILAEIRRRYL
jgi:hypothetical protein